jgi:dihydroorotase
VAPRPFRQNLQYLQTFNGLLINRPEEKLMTQYGNMHEGLTATMLGLKGIPALAEELMVARDLRLLAYAGGKLHFSCLSTAGAVQLVREAKAQGTGRHLRRGRAPGGLRRHGPPRL